LIYDINCLQGIVYANEKTMIIRLLIFLDFILQWNLVFAQDYAIKGNVCDSVTGNALYPANVVIRYSNNFTTCGTTTNENGDFVIRKFSEKRCILTISFIGYKSRQFQIAQGTANLDLGNIRLPQVCTVLNEIEVAWKPVLEYGDEGSVTLNMDLLGNVEDLSVADALEVVPGFYLDFDDKPVFNGRNDYTLLINGEKRTGQFRILNPEFSNYLYSLRNIPARYIKKVEIIPDPMGQYGFYTPVINLITKGDLHDLYSIGAGIGSNDKYQTGFEGSKKHGKLTLSPVADYSRNSMQTRVEEDRTFLSGATPGFTRESDRHSRIEKGQAGLNVGYREQQNTRIDAKIGGDLLSGEKIRCFQNTTFHNSNQASFQHEQYDSEPNAWHASVSLGKQIKLNTPRVSMFRLMSELTHAGSSKNENQFIASKYLQKNKQLNTSILLKANYFTRGKRINSMLDLGYTYQNNYNFSDRLKSTNEQWTSLSSYFRNNRLQRSTASLDIRFNRKLKELGETLRFGFSGQWVMDRISNYREDETSSDHYLQMAGSSGYNGTHLKHNVNINYQYRVLWPTSSQLMSTPEYIGENTIRTGNPELKPQTMHDFTFRLRKGYAPDLTIIGSTGKPSPLGYSLDFSYGLYFDEIVSNQQLFNDSILMQTYTNSSKHREINLTANLFYNYRNRLKFQLGGQFDAEKYFDNFSGNQTGNSWSFFAKARTKIEAKTSLELKYRYNPQQITYRSKIHESFDASVILSRSFMKNNLTAQMEISNIFAYKGLRTEYFGDNFYTNRVIRNESPIIRFRVAYILFSFYNRKEID